MQEDTQENFGLSPEETQELQEEVVAETPVEETPAVTEEVVVETAPEVVTEEVTPETEVAPAVAPIEPEVSPNATRDFPAAPTIVADEITEDSLTDEEEQLVKMFRLRKKEAAMAPAIINAKTDKHILCGLPVCKKCGKTWAMTHPTERVRE